MLSHRTPPAQTTPRHTPLAPPSLSGPTDTTPAEMMQSLPPSQPSQPSPSTPPPDHPFVPMLHARRTGAARALLPLGLCAMLLAGCAPTLVAPDSPVRAPSTWGETALQTDHAPSDAGSKATTATGDENADRNANRGADAPRSAALSPDWWQAFDSPTLERLIDEALAASPDLAIAAERVVQAELAARSAGASLFPTLDLNATTSARAQDGSGISADTSAASSIGLAVAYEIDLWGSRISSLRGAQAQLVATRHDFDAARLSLAAGVANAYTQILAQRARLEIAHENLALAERLYEIVQARHRHGAASALDVSRQRSTVLAQRDAIVPLQTQERQSVRALALLLGRVPQEFALEGERFGALGIPELDALLPGETLARRPDLAASEARLLGAEANIAVARAALFPLRLSIGANAGLSGSEFAFLGLGSPAGTATLALSLVQAVFDGGRLRNQLATTESQQRQLLEEYRRGILTALKEVDDALGAVERARVQETAQREILAESERALRLSEVRYREGSDSLGTLLDTQRSLFSAQDQLIQSRLTRLTATVDLYKALGGGWSPPLSRTSDASPHADFSAAIAH